MSRLLPTLPSLRFDNRTEVDALHFDTVDQNGVGFHVIVAKTAYALEGCGPDGQAGLRALDDPAPLHTEDRYHDDDVEMSVRVESDLAPFKPLCDVVVVGTAYAPGGQPARRFCASVRVQKAEQPAPLPAKPAPLNPMQGLSPHAYEQWQAEVEMVRATRIPGAVLIDKTLQVCGERTLRRLPWPFRLLQSAVAVCSLGLVRLNPFRLTSPVATKFVPMRYEMAQGGQCRTESDTPDGKRVPRRFRLKPEQMKQYPAGKAPVAHDSSQRNPHGRGFARPWFLRAARVKQLPAPRIEYAEAAFTGGRFWRNARGKDALVPAGFGFVGRAWLPRRERVGTFAEKSSWAEDEVPLLPSDFDFRYWNGAPDDQQCAHLEGGEHITLTNLNPADAPFARADERGNTVVSFTLPQQSLFLLAADENEAVATMPLAIDTVVVDTDTGVVEIVWRYCLLADGTFEDARLLHARTDEALARLRAWNTPEDEAATADDNPARAVTL